MRRAFQSGRDLSIQAHVLEAGIRAGLHRHQLALAIADPRVKQALREATDAAYELGVFGVPTIAIDDELFWGDDRPEDAAAHLQLVTAPSRRDQRAVEEGS